MDMCQCVCQLAPAPDVEYFPGEVLGDQLGEFMPQHQQEEREAEAQAAEREAECGGESEGGGLGLGAYGAFGGRDWEEEDDEGYYDEEDDLAPMAGVAMGAPFRPPVFDGPGDGEGQEERAWKREEPEDGEELVERVAKKERREEQPAREGDERPARKLPQARERGLHVERRREALAMLRAGGDAGEHGMSLQQTVMWVFVAALFLLLQKYYL